VEVDCYKGYFVNGYLFHTVEYGANKATWNSGVNLKGNLEYYGTLTEVFEFKYMGGNTVVLFKCDWRDAGQGVRKHPTFDLVDVKMSSKHPGDDVFIFADQAQQIYITPYPSRRPTERGWSATWKCKARSHIEIAYAPSSVPVSDSSLGGCYQEDEMPVPPVVNVEGVENEALLAPDDFIQYEEVGELEADAAVDLSDSDESEEEVLEVDGDDNNSEYEFDNND
jgi:hypothetical protein